jgi:hypothetical protein
MHQNVGTMVIDICIVQLQIFVTEETEVSYKRVEDTFKQEAASYRQKIEEAEAANRRELAARDTKHSQERAECEYRSSLQICHVDCKYAMFIANMPCLLQICNVYCKYAMLIANMPCLLQICHVDCKYAVLIANMPC